ncbi:DUF1496 domain-containing protein [Vibrio marinisediminis]|nr:DUF1496 domain-containing protein [Vibrio marinisediminis]
MKALLLLWLSVFSLTSYANEKSYSTPSKAAIILDAQATNHRLCYYQDQAFSQGALLEVGGYIMRCDEANEFESNGRLKWITFGKACNEESDNE